jgi:tetratricopeptide (TPR) repeat protein
MNLQPHLRRLESADLIRMAAVEPELAYLFRHGLIQDATYSTLMRGQRRHWHRATAEVLESLYPAEARTGELAPILANHYSLAGDRARALPYLVQAGDAAFGNYANAEAASFYRQALDIANQPGWDYDPKLIAHLYSRHGRALELISRFEAALENYRGMENTARQHDDPGLEVSALIARATIHSAANIAQDIPRAVGLLQRASELAHELGDVAAEANIKWTLMLNHAMGGGDPEETTRYGHEALALARAADQRNLIALILIDLWFSRASAGQWELARAGLVEGCAIARELGNLTAVAECLVRISMTDMVAGRYDSALAETAEAIQTAEAINSNDLRALTRLCGGLIYADHGEADRAVEFSQEAVRLGAMTDNVTVSIGTRSDLGRLYAAFGDVEHGLALARQAANDGSRFPLIAPWAGAAIVHLHLLRGEVDEATAEIARLPDYRDLMRRAGFVPMMWGSLALAGIELALARGDAAGATAQASEFIGHLEQHGVAFLLPEARLLQARAMLQLGLTDEARKVLERARDEAGAMSARRMLWPILAALAELGEPGDGAQAGALRRQARDIVDFMAAHAPSAALRRGFLDRPDVQALLQAVA